MDELKLYSVVFAIHENNEWRGYRTRVIAKNVVKAINLVANKYGEIQLKKLEEIEIKEGMFL